MKFAEFNGVGKKSDALATYVNPQQVTYVECKADSNDVSAIHFVGGSSVTVQASPERVTEELSKANAS
jgi:hypothetical protein